MKLEASIAEAAVHKKCASVSLEYDIHSSKHAGKAIPITDRGVVIEF
jgi:hypothetical protein